MYSFLDAFFHFLHHCIILLYYGIYLEWYVRSRELCWYCSISSWLWIKDNLSVVKMFLLLLIVTFEAYSFPPQFIYRFVVATALVSFWFISIFLINSIRVVIGWHLVRSGIWSAFLYLCLTYSSCLMFDVLYNVVRVLYN